MKAYEVKNLIGELTDTIDTGLSYIWYKIGDGWYVFLNFISVDEKLIDIQIVDYYNSREFVMEQND